MNEPLVSIIIPVYNGENSIERCIKSVLEQDYYNIEIIIINDGSTDNTANILKKHKDKRIKIINQTNSGVSSSRNNGIDCSKGEYITFIDADDYIDKSFLKNAIKISMDNNLDLIIGGVQKIFKNKTKDYVIENADFKIYYESDLHELKKKIIGYDCEYTELRNVFFSGPVCKLFKKSCINDNRFVRDIKNGEDTLFNLDIISLCKKIGIISEIWYYYIINSSSATQKYNSNAEVEGMKLLIELEKRIDKDLIASYHSRAIRHIEGIMIMYPFHKQSNFNFMKLRKYLICFRKKNFWNEILSKLKLCEINSLKYKIIAFFLKYKLYFLIIIYYKIIVFKRKKEVN